MLLSDKEFRRCSIEHVGVPRRSNLELYGLGVVYVPYTVRWALFHRLLVLYIAITVLYIEPPLVLKIVHQYSVLDSELYCSRCSNSVFSSVVQCYRCSIKRSIQCRQCSIE